MDVDKIAFPPRLLEILEALSECTFVSIDFEFSGVSTKAATRNGRQSLQDRYAETAESASKYQILQVGLTTATWDYEKGAYVLKPYNIPISPTFDEDLDLERQFSFQSGAVEFLLKNAFNFNVSFEDGVPYLSREEERVAKEKFIARGAKGRFEDMEILDSDNLTRDFLNKVRGEIDEWEGANREGIEIMSRTKHWKEMQDAEMGGDLTSFDRRLIHQIVRNEYPTLVSIGRRQSILIKPLDEERELQIRKNQYKRLKEKIYAHIGFRWIVEALSQGSLANIDLMWFTRDPESGQAKYYEPYAYEARFHRVVDKLKRKSPVLIGHNCFTDLIYLYAAFIGPLPATVGEFRVRCHDLFPVVVDTKYLFTHNCGNLNPMSSLDGIEENLRVQQTPKIETHEDHGKYVGEEMYHEAGYDSYLTARVAILLSAKLEAKGTYVPESGVNTPVTGTPNAKARSTPNRGLDSSAYLTPLDTPPAPSSRFGTKNLFEALLDHDTPHDLEIIGTSFSLNPNARPFPIAATGDGAAEVVALRTPTHSRHTSKDENKGKDRRKHGEELKIDEMMPPFSSDFWRVYANKLRVFGTVEGLLDLDPLRTAAL